MKHWIFWLIAGVVSLLGGFTTLANPLAASLTAELLAGWSFILVGVIAIRAGARAFQQCFWACLFCSLVST